MPLQVPANNADMGPLDWGAPQENWEVRDLRKHPLLLLRPPQDFIDDEDTISLSSGDESDATVVIPEGDWRISAGGAVVRKRKRSASMKRRIAKRREQILAMQQGVRVFVERQGSKDVIDLTRGDTIEDAIDVDRS